MNGNDRIAILRTLDANANRCLEGMRVVEDLVRFVIEDRQLAEQAKQVRHDASDLIGHCLAEVERISVRDIRRDVGTQIQVEGEYERTSLADLARANFSRVKQSLRVIEELVKTGPTTGTAATDDEFRPAGKAAQFESLRYRVYQLETAVERVVAPPTEWELRHLYVLVDCGPSESHFEQRIRGLVEAGADVIQLRDKRSEDRLTLSRAKQLVALTRPFKVLSIINDRPDLAALAKADGVHVGQSELSVSDCRRIISPRQLVGVSTHSLEQARAAVRDGADYIGVGPVFPSQTKAFDKTLGVELVERVAQEIQTPFFAIGGIGLDNIEPLTAAGAHRVAVGNALADLETLHQDTINLKQKLTRIT